jgi:hypothetical protein
MPHKCSVGFFGMPLLVCCCVGGFRFPSSPRTTKILVMVIGTDDSSDFKAFSGSMLTFDRSAINVGKVWRARMQRVVYTGRC